jgi:hypothetical protein
MARVTLKAVKAAHDAYGNEAARWGDDNQATLRALTKYWELRTEYERQTGKEYRR